MSTAHLEALGASQVRGGAVECSCPNIVGMDAGLPVPKKMHGSGHITYQVLSIGRKVRRATPVSVADRNGHAHECLAEAFDYPVSSRLKAS